jgi:hypothetical protein
MNKKRWLSELSELRAIFRDCLPIGEHTEQTDEYFNSLERVIFTNDFKANPNPLRREEFEHDDPDIQYTYLSDALLKERSSNTELRARRQIMGDQSDSNQGEVSQPGSQIVPDLTSIPECSQERHPDHDEWEAGDHPGW